MATHDARFSINGQLFSVVRIGRVLVVLHSGGCGVSQVISYAPRKAAVELVRWQGKLKGCERL